MKQVLIRRGEAVVEEVPAPQVEPGHVLVGVEASCISIGTEMSDVRTSGLPLWKRALEQPDNARKVVQLAMTQGLARTRSLVGGKLSSGNPTGYSAAGVVLEVGEGIDDLRPGDRVACAGAQNAFHAEVIRVPRNLCVPVPDGVDAAAASTVTLGAIALQGVRRAQPTLGETVVVVGLGVLGQLTVQLLRANGCRVIGTDPDPLRLEQAGALGLEVGLQPGDGDVDQVRRHTDGHGADAVIITAATRSDAVISSAFRMCRRKGRVVLVGDVGLALNRADFYAKELDFFISTSYGPGRYDDRYEKRGLDYPIGYVRWTENRNMAAYLRLVADGTIRVAPMIEAEYPIGEAGTAYARLHGEGTRPLMVLLRYPPVRPDGVSRVVANPDASPVRADRVRLAVVGAGGFAKSMHLPNLQALSDRFAVHAIATRSGHNAVATAKQFGARYATTDFAEVLRDADIDAVLIATPHHLHAGMTLEALRAGKHVLVEKPLALEANGLAGILAFYEDAGEGARPMLLTGFNRRFSPFAREIRRLTRERSNPMILNYRMNAGYIPLDDATHGPEGGGRNIGEACHIYDLFTYLTESRVAEATAQAIRPATGHYGPRDNFVATMRFEDGSVATLTYTALGSKEHPKERLDVYVDGMVLSLDDYVRLDVTGAKAKGIRKATADKGQKDELAAFADALRGGREWPIPLWQQAQAMEIAFEVERHLVARPHVG